MLASSNKLVRRFVRFECMDHDLDRADADKVDLAGLDREPIHQRTDQRDIGQRVVLVFCREWIGGECGRFERDEFHIFGLADKAVVRPWARGDRFSVRTGGRRRGLFWLSGGRLMAVWWASSRSMM